MRATGETFFFLFLLPSEVSDKLAKIIVSLLILNLTFHLLFELNFRMNYVFGDGIKNKDTRIAEVENAFGYDTRNLYLTKTRTRILKRS